MSMKFIHHAGFEEITRMLTGRKESIFKLDGRCELYSCDKIPPSVSVSSGSSSTAASSSSTSSSSSMSASLRLPPRGVSAPSSSSYWREEPNKRDEVITARRPRSSTEDHSPLTKQGRHRSGSLGSLDESSSEKVLLAMIGVLNESFHDHDFGTTKPHEFKAQSQSECMMAVNKCLAFQKDQDAQFLNKLWGHVNEAVDMRHCEIFSYEPDLNDDPFSDGMVWQFNFFIFNKSKGRIVYFSCIAKKADMDESFDERTDECPDTEDEEDGTDERFHRYTSGNQGDDYDLDDDDVDCKDFDGVI